MGNIKKIFENLMKLLIKLPVTCIKILKNLVKLCLESIISIFKNKDSITDIQNSKIIEENKIEEKNNDIQTIENSIREKECSVKEDNHQSRDEISIYICGESKDDNTQETEEQKEKTIETEKKKEDNDSKQERNNIKESVRVEPAPVIKTPNLGDSNQVPIGEFPTIIEPEPIITEVLFENIEKNEEIFDKIFNELEKIKNNLSLPELDQKIFLKRINDLEKELKKYKKNLDIEIEDEDIEEDEYSETVSNKFIKILNENYKIVIENILKNIEYKKEQCYRDAFKVFENFLFSLEFRKGNYQIQYIDINNKELEYFNNILIETSNEQEDRKVKEITWQPYILKYKDSSGDEKEMYIPGQLIYYRYGRVN